MYFDGSKSQEGVAIGVILINPKGRRLFLSCRLEFHSKNNVVEYEALIQVLKKVIDMKVKELEVFGDSKIILRKIMNTNKEYSKAYQKEVQDLINHFKYFNILSIPNSEIKEVDSLATVSSRFSPLENFEMSRFYVKII